MNSDPVHTFLMESHNICVEAQFVVDSLPNAELPAVERSTHQLSAIRQIVAIIDDDNITETHREELLAAVNDLLRPLEDFIANPPPPVAAFIPRDHTGLPGRPRYILDLERAHLLHDLGNGYEDIARAMGVSRATLYRHFDDAGIPTSRLEFTQIDDATLDEIVAEISLSHPFVGSVIVGGHLEARGIHLPRLRVQNSLRRVDEIGVLVRYANPPYQLLGSQSDLFRWSGIIRRRVYRVRGSNALWHHDGNEKLRPWGFYVHGCIDGHSRLIIYLACCADKRQATVARLFRLAVAEFGWPSRARGDFGTENNEVERLLIAHWGMAHRAYLRGR